MSVTVSKSAKLFLERLGLRPTYPDNASAFTTGANPMNRVDSLVSPWPTPESEAPQHDPDRGQTEPWPDGFQETQNT